MLGILLNTCLISDPFATLGRSRIIIPVLWMRRWREENTLFTLGHLGEKWSWV